MLLNAAHGVCGPLIWYTVGYKHLNGLLMTTSRETTLEFLFLELYANFIVVMGAQLPVTVCRKGSRLVWEHFDSASAHLQPKRSRAAIAQAVVLDSIVKQIEKAIGLKLWIMKKKLEIKHWVTWVNRSFRNELGTFVDLLCCVLTWQSSWWIVFYIVARTIIITIWRWFPRIFTRLAWAARSDTSRSLGWIYSRGCDVS